jgi:hypothetical protein
MNLIAPLRESNGEHYPIEVARGWLDDFCLWHKADMLNALTNVRF